MTIAIGDRIEDRRFSMNNPVTATVGHSPTEERKVAKMLYIAIGAAVLLGIILFALLGHKKELNPSQTTTPATSGPTADPAK
jgi:hypothetical protein